MRPAVLSSKALPHSMVCQIRHMIHLGPVIAVAYFVHIGTLQNFFGVIFYTLRRLLNICSVLRMRPPLSFAPLPGGK